MSVTSRGNKRIMSNDGQMKLGTTRKDIRITSGAKAPKDADVLDFLLNDSTDELFRIIESGIAEIAGGNVGANSTVEFAADLIPYSDLPEPPLVFAFYTEGADGLNNFGGPSIRNLVDTGTSFGFKQLVDNSIGIIPDTATSGDIKIFTTVYNADSSSYAYPGADVKYWIIAQSASVS